MNSKKLTTVGTTLLAYGIGTGLMFASSSFSRKIIWANTKPCTINELLSNRATVNYSIQNMIDQDEILVHITKSELEEMSIEEKNKLSKLFIMGEGVFETRELLSDQTKQLTFEECVNNSIPLYLSCIPNIDDGTFTVKYFSRDFNHLYKIKSSDKTKRTLMCIFGTVVSYVFAVGIAAMGPMQ